MQPDEPPITAESELMRVAICCFLTVMPKRKAERFLRLIAETLASEEAVSALLPIRPSTHHASASRARRGAAALFASYLPSFLAMLMDR